MTFNQTITNGQIQASQWQEMISSMARGDGVTVDSLGAPAYAIQGGELKVVTPDSQDPYAYQFSRTPQPWATTFQELEYDPKYEGMLVLSLVDNSFWHCQGGKWDRIHKPKEVKTGFTPSFRRAQVSYVTSQSGVSRTRKTSREVDWEDWGSAVVVRDLGEMKEVTVQIRGKFYNRNDDSIVEFGVPDGIAPPPVSNLRVWMNVMRLDQGDRGKWLEADVKDGFVTPLSFVRGGELYFKGNSPMSVNIVFSYITPS